MVLAKDVEWNAAARFLNRAAAFGQDFTAVNEHSKVDLR